MEVLIIKVPSHFPSLSRENLTLHHFPAISQIQFPKSSHFTSLKAHSSSLNGWDELGLLTDSVNSPNSSESTQFRSFLASIGINDRKYVFVFVLGIVCALAISRVRVSSIVVFPSAVLVFAIGFSVGFFRNFDGFGKKKGNLKDLVKFFDEFDAKVCNLKTVVQRALQDKEVSVGDLRSYVDAIEEIRGLALGGRNAVLGFTESFDKLDGVEVGNRKASKKGKGIGDETGFGFLKFLGGLIGQSFVVSKIDKVKDNVKQEATDNVIYGRVGTNISGSKAEKKDLNLIDNDKGNNDNENAAFQSSQNSSYRFPLKDDADGRNRVVVEDEHTRVGKMSGATSRFVDREEYSSRTDRLRFVNDRHISSNTGGDNKFDTLDGPDDMLNSVDFSVSFSRTETETSFVKEQTVNRSSRVFDSNYSGKRNKINRPELGEERVNFKDNFQASDAQPVAASESDSYTSAVDTDDVAFDRYLSEANDLLKKAKEYIVGRQNMDYAEVMLYKSANLLSKATDMKPMSLLAVGQLGNTYLLHGELKLKNSRELRAVLLGSKPLSVENLGGVLKGLDDQVLTRNKLTSVLIDVCDECEGLLSEAGRKYRLALSIDGSDVRALYNWGLALSYRAQLIADIGPKAALDADKMFLAAIDKFDAMLSKGNLHAPEALFRWGVVLQQRSCLRPRNSKEKVKLLQQAKRLFEDALLMGSDNRQVRDALVSCVSELNYRNY